MNQNTFGGSPEPDVNPGPSSTYLRPYLSAENYRSLVVDHCQLVEQFENLVVVVSQLWEMNNAMREALGLACQPLPIAASLACTALRQGLSAWRTAALPACEQTCVGTEQETPSEGYDGLVPASSVTVVCSPGPSREAAMPPAPAPVQ